MSHKQTPKSPMSPQNQGYKPPSEVANGDEAYPMQGGYPGPPTQGGYPGPPTQGGYPGPPTQSGYPGPPILPPGAQPLPGMQTGFQPGFQPGFPPGFQPQFQPGYKPEFQPGYQPGYAPGFSHPSSYPNNPPVMQQPAPQAPGGWMTIPRGLVDCPPGLEQLGMIDQLLVHQKVELLEAFVGFETNNKYTIKNNLGQKVYHAVEDNDCCTRNCCGPLRPFHLKIMDNMSNEVIHLHRPLACDTCLCPLFMQNLQVSSPPGTHIGSVEQVWSLLRPSFTIKNEIGEIVMRMKGPICTFSICGDVEFHIYNKYADREIGKIRKTWSGLAREAFTDSDYFGITFPMDLDIKMKAVLLGACFLIDFMYFEKFGNHERDRPGML